MRPVIWLALGSNASSGGHSSSGIEIDPFRNGFVHERGPLEISAAALDRLIGIIVPAGLDSCRLAIGRGMIVLPADDVPMNPSQLQDKIHKN